MTSLPSRRMVCAVAAGVLAGLATASTAQATTLTSGVLTNSNGAPSAGTVAVYASPAENGRWPMLGSATAGPDGRFTVTVSDPSVLAQYTRGTGRTRIGDYTAWATLADGSTGTWTFSGIVAGKGPATRVLSPTGVNATAASAASFTAASPAPFIRVPVDEPPRRARAAQGYPPPKDCPLVETQVLGTQDALTVIGELNNAYNDGTVAKFTYGTAQETATRIGVATKLAGGEFNIDGETYIRDKGSIADRQARRYARKIRSVFRYKHLKQVGYGTCEGRTYYSVLATRFLGGKDSRVKQRNTLNKCRRDVPALRYDTGGQYHREVNQAVRWTNGASVFGVGVTTQSGFDKDVQLDYNFRGAPGKAHYICGPDGAEAAMTAGRVLSGGV